MQNVNNWNQKHHGKSEDLATVRSKNDSFFSEKSSFKQTTQHKREQSSKRKKI